MAAHQPHSDDRFDIDHGVSGAPPPRRQTNAQPRAQGFIRHSTTQELLPILSKDDPGYEENASLIAAAIRSWNGEAT